ncbi:MAG: sulfatase [Phycisphaerae bacterium]|nr:sulfatase [Phycisphaerae bacterium]
MKKTGLNRRNFVKIFGLSAAALAIPKVPVFSASKNGDKPNILFIFSDDHAFQAISAYGGRLAKVAPTKNIDRIAKEGMIFNKCYVTNSICAPCRAVIQTGKHSHLNGLRDNYCDFDNSQQTFPKILQKNGYQTAIVGKWHLKTRPTGFDYDEVLPGQGEYYNPKFIKRGEEIVHQGYNTDITTDLGLRWLKEERDKNKPFMMMLQYKAPHRKWEPGPDQLTLFDDVTIPEPDNLFDDYSGRGTPAHTQDMSIEKTMDKYDLKLYTRGGKNADKWEKWDAAYGPKNEKFEKANLKGKDLVRWKYQRYMKDYLRCVRSVDDNIGRVLKYLDDTGLAENTVVMYSSDQGFYLGEHGWFDKRFMYEESFRTPLIVRWPNHIKPGTSNYDLVQNLDFAQTFLDIAGAPQPDDMQGASIKPIMLNGKAPDDWRKSLYYQYFEFPGYHSVRRHEGVATKRYKLIHFYDIDEWEFYDLEKDPSEMQSQYENKKYADKIEELKKELLRLKKLYKVPPHPPLRKGWPTRSEETKKKYGITK